MATGLCTATGYLLGLAVARLTRRLGFHPLWSVAARRRGNAALAVTAAVRVPAALVLGAHWQDQVRELVGVRPDQRSYYGLVLVVALVVDATRYRNAVQRRYR